MVFLYFALAGCVVYGRGCAAIKDKPKWLDPAEALLLRTWPAGVGASAIGFLSAKLVDIGDAKWVPVTFVPLAWFLVRRAKLSRPWAWVGWVGVAVVAFVPYMFAMSQIWAGVRIVTDKPEYEPGESIVVTVTSEGYVFNPSIQSVSLIADGFPDYKAPTGSHRTFLRAVLRRERRATPESELARREYVAVQFLPQASWVQREQYRLVTLVPQRREPTDVAPGTTARQH